MINDPNVLTLFVCSSAKEIQRSIGTVVPNSRLIRTQLVVTCRCVHSTADDGRCLVKSLLTDNFLVDCAADKHEGAMCGLVTTGFTRKLTQTENRMPSNLLLCEY